MSAKSEPTALQQASLQALYQRELERVRQLDSELLSMREAATVLQRYALESHRSLIAAQQHIQRLQALHRLGLTMSAPLDRDQTLRETLELLESLVPSTASAVFLAGAPATGRRLAIRGVPLVELPSRAEFAADVVRWVLRADNAGSIRSEDGAWLAVPVRILDKTVGAVVIARPDGAPFDQRERELADLLGSVVSSALTRSERFRDLEAQALSDALTGLANYRYFRNQIELEVARAQRIRYSLGLLIADIDHFKQINDQFGHPAGDTALVAVAAALQQAVRRSDILARVGGEEFAVILPACDATQVQLVGEKLREAVRQIPWTNPANGAMRPLTISVGGTALTGPELSAHELISRADAALLHAKRTGRDRTVVLEGPPPEFSAAGEPQERDGRNGSTGSGLAAGSTLSSLSQAWAAQTR